MSIERIINPINVEQGKTLFTIKTENNQSGTSDTITT